LLDTYNNKRFSKILVAIDGSEPSMDAADYAISMAKNYDAKIIAINVLSAYTETDYYSEEIGQEYAAINETIKSYKQKAEAWLDKVKYKAKQHRVITNFDSQLIINPKPVPASIVEYAEKEDIDLIVIGTRGMSGFRKLLLGSVASRVVTYAHCTVMVVK
jgi:nucleotide-binding universal stress UspA family protein